MATPPQIPVFPPRTEKTGPSHRALCYADSSLSRNEGKRRKYKNLIPEVSTQRVYFLVSLHLPLMTIGRKSDTEWWRVSSSLIARLYQDLQKLTENADGSAPPQHFWILNLSRAKELISFFFFYLLLAFFLFFFLPPLPLLHRAAGRNKMWKENTRTLCKLNTGNPPPPQNCESPPLLIVIFNFLVCLLLFFRLSSLSLFLMVALHMDEVPMGSSRGH